MAIENKSKTKNKLLKMKFSEGERQFQSMPHINTFDRRGVYKMQIQFRQFRKKLKSYTSKYTKSLKHVVK